MGQFVEHPRNGATVSASAPVVDFAAPGTTLRGDLPRVGGSEPLGVLIVDDAASTRRLLRAVLEHSQQFDVVGEAADGSQAIDLARELQPDLVLLDLAMPNLNGANALVEILHVAPKSMVIIVSGAASPPEDLTDAGAAGFVPKGMPPDELLGRLSLLVGRPFGLDILESLDELDRPTLPPPLGLAPPRVAGGRAVVFDGDPVVRTLISRVLNDADIVVLAETTTMPILLTSVELAQPEVVVVDDAFTGSPGTTLLSELRRRSPRSALIVYSAAVERRESALAAGATAFIPKPRIDELAATIRHLSPNR